MSVRSLSLMAMAGLLSLAGCGKMDEPARVSPPDAAPPVAKPGEPQAAEGQQQGQPQDQPQTQQQSPDPAAQAREAAKKRDFDGAIKFAEQALLAAPENAELVSMLANLCQNRGRQLAESNPPAGRKLLIQSADYMARLRGIVGELDATQQEMLGMVLYNAACAHSLEGNPEKARGSLKEAFDAGFSDVGLAETDPDLKTLQADPKFKELIAAARVKVKERARAEASRMLAEFKPFEFSFSLPDTKGAPVSLSGFKGKVVIVDVWGTWCPPCRREIPHFIALRNQYRDAGLEIVGVNYERVPQAQWVEKIEAFIAEQDINYPCVIGDDATRKMIPEFRGYPTTLFIDRAGVVRLKIVGYHPLEMLEAIVFELLGEPSEQKKAV